jgi:transcriptional regulator with XRE-family HTH domain
MRSELVNDVAAGIATYRRAAGLSQAELAARIDRSVSWVSAVEQGRRYAEKLGDVIAIAAVLRCRVEDLTRRPIDPLTSPGARPGGPDRTDDLDAVRTVVLRSPVPEPAGGRAEHIDPTRLQQRVDQAWAVWHGSPTGLSQVGATQPALLGDALASQQQASGPGRPLQWLAAVERGHRWVDRFSDLVAVATVLGCRPDDLLAPLIDPPGTPSTELRSIKIAGVRAVLLGSALPVGAEAAAQAPAPAELRQRVDHAWALWHGSSAAHTELASALPGLLGGALAGHQGAAESANDAPVPTTARTASPCVVDTHHGRCVSTTQPVRHTERDADSWRPYPGAQHKFNQ